jgi:hypothetical protein
MNKLCYSIVLNCVNIMLQNGHEPIQIVDDFGYPGAKIVDRFVCSLVEVAESDDRSTGGLDSAVGVK